MDAILQDLFSLTGRVALITGGNKGLGKAMALGFARAGGEIALAGRNPEELKQTAEEIQSLTKKPVSIFLADMGNREEVNRLGQEVLKKMGKVDILINNAGVNIPQAIDQIVDDSWDLVLEVNLSACMALCRAVVPTMKQNRWGRIIHISSIFGFVSKEKRNAYSATKSALIGLTHASALDLADFGITVNCLAPGPFLTDMPGKILSAQEKAEFARTTAMNRWANPEELVGPALMLASEAGSYITGQVLVVDGGYLCR